MDIGDEEISNAETKEVLHKVVSEVIDKVSKDDIEKTDITITNEDRASKKDLNEDSKDIMFEHHDKIPGKDNDILGDGVNIDDYKQILVDNYQIECGVNNEFPSNTYSGELSHQNKFEPDNKILDQINKILNQNSERLIDKANDQIISTTDDISDIVTKIQDSATDEGHDVVNNKVLDRFSQEILVAIDDKVLDNLGEFNEKSVEKAIDILDMDCLDVPHMSNKEILETLHQFQLQSLLCDANIVSSDGAMFAAHAGVLAAINPYIASKLANCQRGQYLIETSLSTDEIQNMIHSIYTGGKPEHNIFPPLSDPSIPLYYSTAYRPSDDVIHILKCFAQEGLFCDTTVYGKNGQSKLAHSYMLAAQAKYLSEGVKNGSCVSIIYETEDSKDGIVNMDDSVTDEKTHGCMWCGRQFRMENTLRAHELAHIGQCYFKCKSCLKEFQTQYCLTRHEKTHVSKKPFRCNFCQHLFTDPEELDTHIFKHAGLKPFCCKLCGSRFYDRRSLRRHTHSGNKRYKCSICQRKFSTSKIRNRHAAMHTNPNAYNSNEHECQWCKETFAKFSTLRNHKCPMKRKRFYGCGSCRRNFRTFKKLKKHRRIHSLAKPVVNLDKVPSPDKEATAEREVTPEKLKMPEKLKASEKVKSTKKVKTSSKLKTKIENHVTGKPLSAAERGPPQCNICSKTFSSARGYKRHARVHTGEKPYKCGECDRCFADSFTLKIHKYIHTGERPYHCQSCSKAFRDPGLLRAHRKTCNFQNNQALDAANKVTGNLGDEAVGVTQYDSTLLDNRGGVAHEYLISGDMANNQLTIKDECLMSGTPGANEAIPGNMGQAASNLEPWPGWTDNIPHPQMAEMYPTNQHVMTSAQESTRFHESGQESTRFNESGQESTRFHESGQESMRFHESGQESTRFHEMQPSNHTSAENILADMASVQSESFHGNIFMPPVPSYNENMSYPGLPHQNPSGDAPSDHIDDNMMNQSYASEHTGHVDSNMIPPEHSGHIDSSMLNQSYTPDQLSNMPIENYQQTDTGDILSEMSPVSTSNDAAPEMSPSKRKYPCNMCGKEFTRAWNLKLHAYVHGGTKPHVCRFCNQSFVAPSRLKLHEHKCHEKELLAEQEAPPVVEPPSPLSATGNKRPYKCQYCPKAFVRKSKMDDHVRVRHGHRLPDKSIGERSQVNTSDANFGVSVDRAAVTTHSVNTLPPPKSSECSVVSSDIKSELSTVPGSLAAPVTDVNVHQNVTGQNVSEVNALNTTVGMVSAAPIKINPEGIAKTTYLLGDGTVQNVSSTVQNVHGAVQNVSGTDIKSEQSIVQSVPGLGLTNVQSFSQQLPPQQTLQPTTLQATTLQPATSQPTTLQPATLLQEAPVVDGFTQVDYGNINEQQGFPATYNNVTLPETAVSGYQVNTSVQDNMPGPLLDLMNSPLISTDTFLQTGFQTNVLGGATGNEITPQNQSVMTETSGYMPLAPITPHMSQAGLSACTPIQQVSFPEGTRTTLPLMDGERTFTPLLTSNPPLVGFPGGIALPNNAPQTDLQNPQLLPNGLQAIQTGLVNVLLYNVPPGTQVNNVATTTQVLPGSNPALQLANATNSPLIQQSDGILQGANAAESPIIQTPGDSLVKVESATSANPTLSAIYPLVATESNNQPLTTEAEISNSSFSNASQTTVASGDISAAYAVFSDSSTAPESTAKSPKAAPRQRRLTADTPDGRHRCDHCDKTFRRKSDMVRHVRLHTGEFKCNNCGKCLRDSSSLKKHLEQHANNSSSVNLKSPTRSQISPGVKLHPAANTTFTQTVSLQRSTADTITTPTVSHLQSAADTTSAHTVSHLQTSAGMIGTLTTPHLQSAAEMTGIQTVAHLQSSAEMMGTQTVPHLQSTAGMIVPQTMPPAYITHTQTIPVIQSTADNSVSQPPPYMTHTQTIPAVQSATDTTVSQTAAQDSKPFSCGRCDMKFTSADELKKHVQTHLKCHPCRWCPARFSQARNCRRHEEKNHKILLLESKQTSLTQTSAGTMSVPQSTVMAFSSSNVNSITAPQNMITTPQNIITAPQNAFTTPHNTITVQQNMSQPSLEMSTGDASSPFTGAASSIYQTVNTLITTPSNTASNGQFQLNPSANQVADIAQILATLPESLPVIPGGINQAINVGGINQAINPGGINTAINPGGINTSINPGGINTSINPGALLSNNQLTNLPSITDVQNLYSSYLPISSTLSSTTQSTDGAITDANLQMLYNQRQLTENLDILSSVTLLDSTVNSSINDFVLSNVGNNPPITSENYALMLNNLSQQGQILSPSQLLGGPLPQTAQPVLLPVTSTTPSVLLPETSTALGDTVPQQMVAAHDTVPQHVVTACVGDAAFISQVPPSSGVAQQVMSTPAGDTTVISQQAAPIIHTQESNMLTSPLTSVSSPLTSINPLTSTVTSINPVTSSLTSINPLQGENPQPMVPQETSQFSNVVSQDEESVQSGSGSHSLENSKDKSSDEKKHHCIPCGKSYHNRQGLQRHLQSHEGEKPFKCTFCDQSFIENSFLKIHINLHTGEKPYICKNCNQAFHDPRLLRRHAKTHNVDMDNKADTGKAVIVAQQAIVPSADQVKANQSEPSIPSQTNPTRTKPKVAINPEHSIEALAISQNGKHTCGLCQKTFTKRCGLRRHMMLHSSEPRFSCEVCGRKFMENYRLKVHRYTHTGETPYPCGACGKQFASPQNLRSHKCPNRKTPEGSIVPAIEKPQSSKTCDSAEKMVDAKQTVNFNKIIPHDQSLLSHAETAASIIGQSELKDQTKQETSAKVLFKHPSVSTGSMLGTPVATGSMSCLERSAPPDLSLPPKPPSVAVTAAAATATAATSAATIQVCDICKKTFTSKPNLLRHQKLHADEKHFRCPRCRLLFYSLNGLKKHKLTHPELISSSVVKKILVTPEQPMHKCSKCEKTFTTQDELTRHMASHSRKKQQKCAYCDMTFRGSYELKLHSYTHTGEKPYKCKWCNKAFNRPNTLSKHELLHHPSEKVKAAISHTSQPIATVTTVQPAESSVQHQAAVGRAAPTTSQHQADIAEVASSLSVHSQVASVQLFTPSQDQVTLSLPERPILPQLSISEPFDANQTELHLRQLDDVIPLEHAELLTQFENADMLEEIMSATDTSRQNGTLGDNTLHSPNKCIHCHKTFSDEETLKNHACDVNIMIGSKPGVTVIAAGNHPSESDRYKPALTKGLISPTKTDINKMKLGMRPAASDDPKKCHRCKVCEKTFTKASSLKVHNNLHTGETPYRCAVCDQAFCTPDRLRGHKRKHKACSSV